ncbi:TetR/AcrR family transcriptional regulator [Herbaspirillum sp. NPDC087042]|uniref:TetR/AcrR family transcriptional regulator n=1 Tax=Herbaspirillum sp. NPDC087042 TaxID=3364004 RepID=UPI0038204F80
MKTSTSARATDNETGKPNRKEDILLSAERLFAMRSYDAVSIRDIADEAGVPSRLVGYYYGKKEDLFDAIFVHRQDNIAERRRRIQDADLQGPPEQALREIVNAWCGPVITMRDKPEGEHFLVLVARSVWEQSEVAIETIKRHYDALAEDFIAALAIIYPDRPRTWHCWAYQWSLGALLMHIADRRVERLSRGAAQPGDPSALPRLVSFLCAGIHAMAQEPAA